MLRFIPLSELKLRRGAKYLIKNLIPAQGITVPWGPPKCGKTFIILDMALHIAAGIEYRGRKTLFGPVAYCGLEGGDGIPARLVAACKGMNIEDRNLPFKYCIDSFQFTKTGGADELIKYIEEAFSDKPPVLVILDTLNRSLNGKENDDEDMTHYTRCAEEVGKKFNCAIIVIHHCGVSGDKPRGHTALTGTCAAQLKIARANKMPVGEGKPMMVSTTVEFMKDGPEGSIEYSWLRPITITDPEDPEYEPEDTCYVVPAPEPGDSGDELNVLSGHTKKALSLLQELLSQEDEERVTHDRWRGFFHAHTKGKKESVAKAFYRASDDLKKKGVIIREGPWVFLPKPEDPKSNPGI
jgi:SpoU rRNA methylase family enzyme